MIANEAQLEDTLSQPSDADIEAVKDYGGDVLLLGVAGKMGPSLARRIKRAANAAGVSMRVIGVSRFSTEGSKEELEASGIEAIPADLLDRHQLEKLPDAPNVIYLAGRKFGSTGAESLTWAMNALLPGLVAERYRRSRIVAFSSGNIYPFVPVTSGGATEQTPPGPIGEYAQSGLARERIFEYASREWDVPAVLLRLNYAVELRYGVLLDIGTNVFERRPVDVTMSAVNVIWQGDANSVCLRSFNLCQSPAAVLNVTGPEILSVQQIAIRFGQIFGVEPQFTGAPAVTALLNNAARCHRLFGYPSVTAEQVIEWTAQWIGMAGRTLNKPTHFETRDGRF